MIEIKRTCAANLVFALGAFRITLSEQPYSYVPPARRWTAQASLRVDDGYDSIGLGVVCAPTAREAAGLLVARLTDVAAACVATVEAVPDSPELAQIADLPTEPDAETEALHALARRAVL